jgi:UrcA family protein
MSSNIRTISSLVLSYCGATALACGLVAPEAFARDQVRTENVQFQDLNLDTPGGLQTLRSRIHLAAQRVCSQPAQWQQAAAAACAENAEATALERAHAEPASMKSK